MVSQHLHRFFSYATCDFCLKSIEWFNGCEVGEVRISSIAAS